MYYKSLMYGNFFSFCCCVFIITSKKTQIYIQRASTLVISMGCYGQYHIHVNTVTLLVHTYWYVHIIILYMLFVFQWHSAIRNLRWLLKGVIYYCNNTVEYLSGTALSAVCIGSAKLWIECFFKFIFNIITICSVAACLFYSFIVFESCRV